MSVAEIANGPGDPGRLPACKLRYSEALVRKAVTAFWLRGLGWRFFVAMALLLGWFVYSLSTGDQSWWVGVMGSVLGIGVISSIAFYFLHYRASMGRLRRMKVPEATFECGEERFKITADSGSSDLLWSAIAEVWRFPEFWLLFVARAQFITFPLADTDSEIREFILNKIKSHGGKIA